MSSISAYSTTEVMAANAAGSWSEEGVGSMLSLFTATRTEDALDRLPDDIRETLGMRRDEDYHWAERDNVLRPDVSWVMRMTLQPLDPTPCNIKGFLTNYHSEGIVDGPDGWLASRTEVDSIRRYDPIPEHDPRITASRRTLGASFLHTSTQNPVNAIPCRSCQKGHGIFKSCVSRKDVFGGACANCVLSGSPERCDLADPRAFTFGARRSAVEQGVGPRQTAATDAERVIGCLMKARSPTQRRDPVRRRRRFYSARRAAGELGGSDDDSVGRGRGGEGYWSGPCGGAG